MIDLDPAILSAFVLGIALLLFLSGRIRHDLVALAALFISVLTGLVAPEAALAGFADPAVIAVAAVLVVGRALELSGAPAAAARALVPASLPFRLRLAGLLVAAAVLSAFINNIAALVVAMPLATEIARDANQPRSAVLMPLAFATILGGMTTLIGTPANLILSSVRKDLLGEGFGFFDMAPVGIAVAGVGLAYLLTVGQRLIPRRVAAGDGGKRPWRVFELVVPQGIDAAAVLPALRAARARLLATFNLAGKPADGLGTAGNRLLLLSRAAASDVADATGLSDPAAQPDPAGTVTTRVTVAHGSPLVGERHIAVEGRSEGEFRVVAAGPRIAAARMPLSAVHMSAGDQLFLRGPAHLLGSFLSRQRLLEIDRFDPVGLLPGQAIATVGLFLAALVAIVGFGASPALAFLAAAAAMAAAGLIRRDDIYTAIDWPVIVLLGAMIPVGQSFSESGAAAHVADMLVTLLSDMPLAVILGAVCAATMLLSIFLNNVATAVIMGPLAVQLAKPLGIDADPLLLAVLIGASSDFLTPIGHQNNLLVMGPGGYRFTDYARVGAGLTLLVVVTAAVILAAFAG
jgi:di/tricarboxylate transporter